MENKKVKQGADKNTEANIKRTAHSVFLKKGFAATRMRDIANEAGINLALINYYFRSKEKLFDIVMLETMQVFFKSIAIVFNSEETTLEEKIENIVINYINLLTANPDIPLFLLNELQKQPDKLMKELGLKEIVMNSVFLRQFQKRIKKGKITTIHPLHFLMNLMGMIVFPFIGSPIIKGLGNLSQKDFEILMQQRKKMIPVWINAILKVK